VNRAGPAEHQSYRELKLGTPMQVSAPDAKTPVPIQTRKKLPWLDDKPSRAVASASTVRKSTVMPHPVATSPKRPESIHPMPISSCKPAAKSIRKAAPTIRPSSTVRLAHSSSVLQRRSLHTPPERGVSSTGTPIPTPALDQVFIQHRRDFVSRKTSSPLKDIKTLKVPPSSEKPSVILMSEPISIDGTLPDQEEDPLSDSITRKGSLGAVLPHLERYVTPDTYHTPIQHNTLTPLPLPQAIRCAEVSPSQPYPNKNPFEPENRRKLSNAIEGLEDMVQEAVNIAEDSKSQGQVEEIYQIIEAATDCIQQASTASTQYLMETSSPLEISGSCEEISGSSSESESSSSEAPTVPRKASFVAPIMRTARQDSMQSDQSRLQRSSVAIDWAYQNGKSLAENLPNPSQGSTCNSSTSDLDEGDRSRYSTRSDLLLPPQLAQTASRDHVDFVVRPLIARGHSRGRSRRRKESSSETGGRRRHRRNFRNSDHTSRRRSRSRRHQCSSYDQTDPSFDEEDIPIRRHHATGFRQHKHELSVRDQIHHHTFGIHRNHRRQPIARNWSTGKKRITATIACINTALLGIIVGIYVSSSYTSYITTVANKSKGRRGSAYAVHAGR
jgi:hypothetical protein